MISAGWRVASVLLISLNATTAGAESQPWTQWHNSLSPEGPTTETLTLAEDGQSTYRIVIPADPISQDVKAAEELRYWLHEITGSWLEVINEGTPLGPHLPISVGRTNLLGSAGIPEVGVDLGDEGYGIAARGRQLFLWGGSTRGAIHAVYALLEEDIGCRWYTAEHSRIPWQPVLTLQPVERTSTPPLRIRDPFYHVAFDESWSLRNRTNAPWALVREEWGGHIDYDGLFVHTVLTLVPPSQYFAQHPEYYMMNGTGERVPSQLCCTNPEVAQIVTQRVRQILANHPETEIVEISAMDDRAICLCPSCRAIDEPEGSGMGSMLYLVNQVAEQIEADHPGVLISTLAYFSTLQPPATARPRHNVIVRLCNTVAWSWPLTPMEQSQFGPLLLSWSAIHDNISIWDYTVNYYHYLAPLPNLQVVAADVAFMAANHVTGIMAQGGYQCTSERDTMRAWVLAKLMWEPARDYLELQQDFIWGHFGNAAPAIAEYNELLRNQGILYAGSLRHPPGGIRFSMDQPFLSAEFIDAADALFDQAESLAEDEPVLHRVERERLPILYVKLEKGPEFVGSEYGEAIDRFEAIARREGVTRLREGAPDLDARLEEYRRRWDEYRYVPFGPGPADDQEAVSARPVLTWSVRQAEECTFTIHLGSTDPPGPVASQSDTGFEPGTLAPLRSWYWRIDSVVGGRTYTGPVWRFTTRRHPDFDADGDVDQEDFGLLQACLSGPVIPQTEPACASASLDGDEDVDPTDLGLFLQCMTAPFAPPPLHCRD